MASSADVAPSDAQVSDSIKGMSLNENGTGKQCVARPIGRAARIKFMQDIKKQQQPVQQYVQPLPPGPGVVVAPTHSGPSPPGGLSSNTASRPLPSSAESGWIDNADIEENDENVPSKAEESLLAKVLRTKLVDVKKEVEIARQNPNSPLYSVKTFEELKLSKNLLKGVYVMGFTSPSKIQETALPLLLQNPPQNMIAQSQSGTGKTAAFSLAMLSRVDPMITHPQVLCLAPTYELALQIGSVVNNMGKFLPDIKVGYAVRGERVPRGTQITQQIIIGTPGTVLDWAIKMKVFDLQKIRVFVLDEADVMIATQGHQDQSIRIHNGLDTANCQMLLFSATYDNDVMEFARQITPGALTIRLRREEESLQNIKQFYVICHDRNAKFDALCKLYGTISISQAIIFCHTRRAVQWLHEKLIEEGHAVAMLSGEMSVQDRVAVLERFRSGKEKVLLTTNVCARGIDIEQVSIVINYDMPIVAETRQADCETYLHRIGRTGRFGKEGLAINFVDNRSQYVLEQIEAHFGRKVQKLDIEDIEQIGD